MGTYLIAQPCAIMIRGLPRWLDSQDSTLPWVASTRSSPIQVPPAPRPHTPLGTSCRAIIIPGQPSTWSTRKACL